MPEGFNSIADLKIVVDANTERLHGGLELAQGLISRFKGGADEQLGAFDNIVQKAAGGVGMLVTRLGAVSVALGIASEALAQAKDYGRQFAEQTGTQEQFQRLEASVDDLQDALVGGLFHAFEQAQAKGAELVSVLSSVEAQTVATEQSTESLAGSVQRGLAEAFEGVSRRIRELGPDAQKSLTQIEWEITKATDRIKELREEGDRFAGIDLGPIREFFGLAQADAKAMADELERALVPMQLLASVQRFGDDLLAQKKADDEAYAAAQKSIEALDREIRGLEQKTAVLGMTSAAQSAYIAQQRVMAELDATGVEITGKVRADIDGRIGRIRELTATIEAHNKAERERQQGEAREKQIDRVIGSLDAEIAAQMRRAEAIGRTNAEQQASERVERALLAIRQAGREPTEAEIAGIRRKGDALREILQVNEEVKKSMASMQEYSRVVTSSMEGVFRQFTQGAELSVKDMVRSMLADLAMLTFRQGVTGPLQQGLSGLLNSVFGGMGGGGSYGSSWAPITIPAFAEGGRPPLDRPSLIGEKGPELWLPDQTGTVIPNSMLKALGDGRSPAPASESSKPPVALSVSIDARGATPDAVAMLKAQIPAIVLDTVTDASQRGLL